MWVGRSPHPRGHPGDSAGRPSTWAHAGTADCQGVSGRSRCVVGVGERMPTRLLLPCPSGFGDS